VVDFDHGHSVNPLPCSQDAGRKAAGQLVAAER
jgi:hypothetical protein